MPTIGKAAGLATLAVLATTAVHFSPLEPHYPWAPQFLGRTGLGPVDVRGGRPELIPPPAVVALLAAWGIAALIVGAARCHRLPALRRPEGRAASLVVAVLAGQAVAVIGPSITPRDSVTTYDRYLLPLLPLAVVAALWSVQPWVRWATAGWAIVAVAGPPRRRRPPATASKCSAPCGPPPNEPPTPPP